jgi:hypothetical protein
MKSRMERYIAYFKDRHSCVVTALDDEYAFHAFKSPNCVSRIVHLCLNHDEVVVDRKAGKKVPQGWYIREGWNVCVICEAPIPKRWKMLNKLFRMKGL